MRGIGERIASYTPTAEAADLLRNTPFLLLGGITGAGRDTMIHKLVETGKYYDYVTTTTRAMRVNNGIPEQDGVEYFFVDTATALDMIEAREFAEVSVVHERISGLSVDELRRLHDSGKIGVTDITPDGIEKYKQISPDARAAFVLPPSFEQWRERALARYETTAAFFDAWRPRRDSALRELDDAAAKPYYQFVVNDKLSAAVEAADRIAHGEVNTPEERARALGIVASLREGIEAFS